MPNPIKQLLSKEFDAYRVVEFPNALVLAAELAELKGHQFVWADVHWADADRFFNKRSDHYGTGVGSETQMVDSYIKGHTIRAFPFCRQPTAYIVKE